MIDTSSVNLLQLIGGNLKKLANTRGGEYGGACPFCGGEDRFRVWPQDNTWSCRQCVDAEMTPQDAITFIMKRDNVDFRAAVMTLGLGEQLNSNGHAPAPAAIDTRIEYKDLADYAAVQGVPEQAFIDAGWELTTWQQRPAFKYPTRKPGRPEPYYRVRFIDGEKPKYKPCEEGTPDVWYGLDKAIGMGLGHIYICNGEASVIVAQHYGVPACATTGGERAFHADTLAELKSKATGLTVYLTMDCDMAGVNAATARLKQLPDAIELDLGLPEHGDLGNFCAGQKMDSNRTLQNLIVEQTKPGGGLIVDDAQSAKAYLSRLQGVGNEPMVLFPIRAMWSGGGFCQLIPVGNMISVAGVSGGNKTTFLETCADAICADDQDVIYRGSEWTPEQMIARRVQRITNGFVKLEDYLGHIKYQQQQRNPALLNGTHHEQTGRFIKPLSESQQTALADATSTIANPLLGQQHYIDDATVEGSLYLEDWLEAVADYLTALRKRGRTCYTVMIDYIDLEDIRPRKSFDGESPHEVKLTLIQQMARKAQFVPFIAVQVRKESSSEALRFNRLLDGDDMMYLKPNKFKLGLSINTVFEREPDNKKIERLEKLMTSGGAGHDKAQALIDLEYDSPTGDLKHDYMGQLLQTDRRIISVWKNSRGASGSQTFMFDMDWQVGQFMDYAPQWKGQTNERQ